MPGKTTSTTYEIELASELTGLIRNGHIKRIDRPSAHIINIYPFNPAKLDEMSDYIVYKYPKVKILQYTKHIRLHLTSKGLVDILREEYMEWWEKQPSIKFRTY
jgi:hypothetical protein